MRRLLLLAKAPVPGLVKTRLCPPLSPEEAARLAEAFLLDEVERFVRLPGVELSVLYSPDGSGDLMCGLIAPVLEERASSVAAPTSRPATFRTEGIVAPDSSPAGMILSASSEAPPAARLRPDSEPGNCSAGIPAGELSTVGLDATEAAPAGRPPLRVTNPAVNRQFAPVSRASTARANSPTVSGMTAQRLTVAMDRETGARRSLKLVPQGGGDLGERLFRGFDAACGSGASVIAVGSDSPDMPDALIEGGFACLEAGDADVVLGPARDGGYYLIGMRRAHAEVFRGIPWSTAGVFGTTVRRADTVGLRVSVLPPWEDVDDLESLRALRDRLVGEALTPAPRTRAFLEGLEIG